MHLDQNTLIEITDESSVQKPSNQEAVLLPIYEKFEYKRYCKCQKSGLKIILPDLKPLTKESIPESKQPSFIQKLLLTKKKPKIYGRDLEDLPESLEWIDGIPKFLYELMSFIRKHCLQVQGIFRMSASVAAIKKSIKLLGNQKVNVFKMLRELTKSEEDAAQLAAALIKAFFREMPTKLLNSPVWMEIQLENNPYHEQQIVAMLSTLSTRHQALFDALIHLMLLIAEQSETNKMSVTNLATCLAPNVLCIIPNDSLPSEKEDNVVHLMQQTMHAAKLTCYLIEHYESLKNNNSLYVAVGYLQNQLAWIQYGDPIDTDFICLNQFDLFTLPEYSHATYSGHAPNNHYWQDMNEIGDPFASLSTSADSIEVVEDDSTHRAEVKSEGGKDDDNLDIKSSISSIHTI